jgi:VWFA-related protein
MRIRLAALLGFVTLAATAVAQTAGPRYQIEKEGRVHQATRNGQLYLTVQFKITAPDGQLALDVHKDDIVIEEDGRRVTAVEIQQPSVLDTVTAVLALDVSGSMAERDKIEQAKQAARSFLDRLHDQADCGLILFDHRLLDPIRPAGDPKRFADHRQHLRLRIDAARPGGGTAYLDATAEAVGFLRNARGRKAVVLLTDGVDLNSSTTLDDVVEQARAANVPVYTVGVGEPGRSEPVTTVLVLDRSGSMNEPAGDGREGSKIAALRRAASRFVDLMRPTARTTLLPFSDRIARPGPFTNNKLALKRRIQQLEADGGTLLFDATYTAIETLEAERPEGKRAVVVLTDGKEEEPVFSVHRVEEVIDRARETNTPLHMLGFGRRGDIDEPVMRRMARETGGTYHHTRSENELFQTFEDLSIRLHDDGIDEAALRELADKTGGKYFHVREASGLSLIYEKLATELQTTYTVTFPSRRSSHDGTSRGIDISVMRQGVRLSEVAQFDYQVRGLVVPDMHGSIYLGLLALLGVLLVLPAGVRTLYRFYGGA